MSLMIFSCEKVDLEDINSEEQKKGFTILQYANTSGKESKGIEVSNHILSFATENDFNNTLDSLESVYENYTLNFEREYAGTDDEGLNNLISTLHIDLDAPLTNFENHYRFKSLRNTINEKEDEWLSHPDPDFNNSPQIHSIESHVERTLWNEKGEIMVGGKIYKYDSDHTKYIKIEDGDLDKLALINSGDLGIYSDPLIFVEYLNIPGDYETQLCKRNDHHSTSVAYQSFRVVCANRIKSKSWEWGQHAAYASTYSYKKINNSWKRWTTTVKVGYDGNKYINCSQTPTQLTNNKQKRHNHVVISHKRAAVFGVRWFSLTNSYSTLSSTHSNGGAALDYFYF